MNAITSSAARWRAIADRDQSANSFVYAVRTTGIYCRPSCPARLARRANIDFYDSPAQAEEAGYRSCKRCKPHLHVMVDPHIAIVQRACEMISSSPSGQKPKLHELAAEANLTPSHFHRVFKKTVGVTPGQYARGGLGGSGKQSSKVGLHGSAKALRMDESSEDSSYNPSLANDQGFNTPPTEDSVAIDVNLEGSAINWNEFDAMLATVASPGRAVNWGDDLRVSSFENAHDTNIENFDPLGVKGSLSSNNQPLQLSYEDVLDNISTNTDGSMTELLRGSFKPQSRSSEELEQSAIPVSPLLFEQSDVFWSEEGLSSYQ